MKFTMKKINYFLLTILLLGMIISPVLADPHNMTCTDTVMHNGSMLCNPIAWSNAYYVHITATNAANQTWWDVKPVTDFPWANSQWCVPIGRNQNGTSQWDDIEDVQGELVAVTVYAPGFSQTWEYDQNWSLVNLSTNLTIRAESSEINIAGVFLTLNFIDDSILTGITNSDGIKIFNNIIHQPTEEIELIAEKTGYNDVSFNFEIPNVSDWNLTVYLAVSGIPTPTPTLAPFDTWTMDIYPEAINLGDSAQLYISCSNSSKLASAQTVLYYENDNLGAYSDYRLIGVYHYNSSTVNWDFRPNNSVPYDYSPHDPALLMVTPKTNGEYTYQAAIFGTNSIPFGTATGNLLIGAQGGQSSTLTMLLFAQDELTTSHLSNYQLQVTDYTGFTRYFDVEYDLSLSLQRGGIYTLGGIKEGYQSSAITFTVPVSQSIQMGDFGAMVKIGLFPLDQIPTAGNTTITIHVDDKETYYPMSNVQITMSGITVPKFTGSQGESVFFIKPQNTQFTVTAVKSGYCSVSETKNTSTNTNMYVPLFMKFGACAGVQPTHTPIPNATSIIPTITPIGGYGQLNGTVGVCNTTATNLSWIQTARNYVACGGIDDLLSQNLLIAVLIILLIGSIAASKAHAIGFAIGAVLGAIISMALGLIPFWVIVVLIIVSIAILSLKIVFSKEG